MIAVFDGHNDALTRDDHARLASGRDGGHLDLPRMRAGGVRGGDLRRVHRLARLRLDPVERDDGVREYPARRAGGPAEAAASATAAAGRLAALERAGARADRALGGRPRRRPRRCRRCRPRRCCTSRAPRRSTPSSRRSSTGMPPACARSGPVWSRSNAFGHGVPFIFPVEPRHRAGADRGRPRARAALRRAGDPRRPQPPQREGVLGRGARRAGAAGGQPLRRPRPGAHHPQPHRRPARRDRGPPTGWSGSSSAASSSAPTSQDDADTPLAVIAQHAAYVAERIGVRHVALGSDFDGTRSRPSWATSAGCRGCWRRCVTPGSATPSSRPSPGTTGAACSAPGGADRTPLTARRRRSCAGAGSCATARRPPRPARPRPRCGCAAAGSARR